MQAVILAGGKGTRLHPYTMVLPKPLMPLDDVPILEVIIRQLRYYGVTDVILAIGHMPHLFRAVFDDGSRFGVKIKYSLEEKPLGTAGPLSCILDDLDDDFLVMNGDLLTTLNYREMFEAHRARGAAATIGVYPRQVHVDFGVVELDESSALGRYIEKPTYDFLVSMGVNILNKKAISAVLQPNVRLDIPDLMLALKGNGHLVHCFRQDCTWLDIGRVDDYQNAIKIFTEQRAQFLPSENR